jgi:hypothetical protein
MWLRPGPPTPCGGRPAQPVPAKGLQPAQETGSPAEPALRWLGKNNGTGATPLEFARTFKAASKASAYLKALSRRSCGRNFLLLGKLTRWSTCKQREGGGGGGKCRRRCVATHAPVAACVPPRVGGFARAINSDSFPRVRAAGARWSWPVLWFPADAPARQGARWPCRPLHGNRSAVGREGQPPVGLRADAQAFSFGSTAPTETASERRGAEYLNVCSTYHSNDMRAGRPGKESCHCHNANPPSSWPHRRP